MSALGRARAVAKGILARVFPVVVEFCHDCGRQQPLVWTAGDELWDRFAEGQRPLCPECFDVRARRGGTLLRWVPREAEAAGRRAADPRAARAERCLDQGGTNQRCGQCGEPYHARACGPTHAAVAAARILFAPDLARDVLAGIEREAALERRALAAEADWQAAETDCRQAVARLAELAQAVRDRG